MMKSSNFNKMGHLFREISILKDVKSPKNYNFFLNHACCNWNIDSCMYFALHFPILIQALPVCAKDNYTVRQVIFPMFW